MNGQLTNIVERFAGKRVLLVGDFMLDRYVFGDAERISPEAPVPVLRVVERQDRVGGAGSVALNVAALGGHIACVGLLGRDVFGERVAAMLQDAGADTSGLITADDRPTITKTRLVGLAEHRHRQQILRVDDECVAPPAPHDAEALLEIVRRQVRECDVVCLEDYDKGLLASEFAHGVIAAAREAGKPVLVDPARSPDWQRYNGATLLTPNRAELEIGARRTLATDAAVDEAAGNLVASLKLEGMIVTLGREGARLVQRDRETGKHTAEHFPTRPRAVYDNTGAGDAVLAMAAVAIAAGATRGEAVQLANIAGGLEVSKFGCVPITRNEVLAELHGSSQGGLSKLRSPAELAGELTARRNRGETVVFTNGCFDILHPGHLELLEKAKALGSLLVVAINSDGSVRRQNKGPDRPIRGERDRVRMLAGLEAVDYVVIYDEDTPARVIETVAPDVLVKGSDWTGNVVGQEFVEGRGGKVVLMELVEGYSTTAELERIRNGDLTSN